MTHELYKGILQINAQTFRCMSFRVCSVHQLVLAGVTCIIVCIKARTATLVETHTKARLCSKRRYARETDGPTGAPYRPEGYGCRVLTGFSVACTQARSLSPRSKRTARRKLVGLIKFLAQNTVSVCDRGLSTYAFEGSLSVVGMPVIVSPVPIPALPSSALHRKDMLSRFSV
jgi:hypothetical protein